MNAISHSGCHTFPLCPDGLEGVLLFCLIISRYICLLYLYLILVWYAILLVYNNILKLKQDAFFSGWITLPSLIIAILKIHNHGL